MPFGRRRFQSIVFHDHEMCAYFLPLHDLGAPAEYVTEEALRAEIASHASADDAEERLAVKAFESFNKGKKGTRGSAEAALERKLQRSIADPLEPQERALVERWRKLLTLKALPHTAPLSGTSSDHALLSSRHDLDDLTRRVLAEILDVYLPAPKGT